MDAQLIPPIGTSFFKLYTVTLAEAGKFSLTVTFYVYVANVKPTEPNFTAKGGKVYIIVVYNGSVIESSAKATHINLSLMDLTGVPNGLLSCTQQLPILGSGTKEGDYNFYTIDFRQTMNMYNNGGNTAFEFSARYRKEFSLYKFVQEPFQYPPEAWGVNLKPLAEIRAKEPTINNFQVFEANRLTVAKIALMFSIVVIEPRADSSESEHLNPSSGTIDSKTAHAYITYDLDFSAETMASAVVGGRTHESARRND